MAKHKGMDMRPGSRATHVLIAMAGAILFLACEDASTPGATDGMSAGRKRWPGIVAFVGAGRRDPLWPVLKASAERYDRELCSVNVRFLCPAGDSPQDQISLLASLDEPELRGLCVQINDADALQPVLHRLQSRGILVVSMVRPGPQDVCVAHAGFDEMAIGRALAETAAHAIDEQGTLMLLHAGTSHPVYGPRLLGFQEEMGRHRRVAVLARIDCAMDPRQARAIIRERSERYPRLSAWVALDDWPIRGPDVGGEPLPATCRLITFGGVPDHWPPVRQGTCPALVAANYGDMGVRALQACETAVRNAKALRFKGRYIAPLRTIWPTNLDAYVSDWNVWLAAGSPSTAPAGGQR